MRLRYAQVANRDVRDQSATVNYSFVEQNRPIGALTPQYQREKNT